MRDSDAPQSKTAEPKCLPRLALTFVIVGAAALVFELAKDFTYPQITLWVSHLITIGFSTITVTIAAALVFRRYHQLLRHSHEEVAERQRAEEALATERNRLRAVIDAVPDQIYVKDSQGRFLVVNDSLARALGATKHEEVLGKTDRDFFPADLASQYAADDQRVLQSGEPLINKEEPALDLSTAASTWQLTTKVPLRNQEGATVGTVGVCRDISARKQDEETLRIHTRQLEAVRAVNQEITRELDLVALLDLILQRTVDLVGASGGTILFWDEARQALVPQIHSVLFGPLDWQSIPVGRGVVGRVAATRTGLIVNDYHSWAGAISTALTRTGVTASMAEPLLYRDKLVGVINLVHTGDRATFTDRDGHILRLLAAQAAIAIENARLYAATEQGAREARSLYEVAHSLTTSLDPMEVLRLISVKTTELLGTPHAQVVLWDKNAKTLRLGAAYGTETVRVQQQEFRLGQGVNGIVAQTQQPLIVNDYQAFPHRAKEFTELTAGIGAPLLYRDQLLGVLTSHSTRTDWVFTREHLALLTSFADSAAIALENARLYQQTQTRQRQLEAVRAISTEIARELDLATVLHLIARRLSELMERGRGVVWLWDDAAQLLVPYTTTGVEDWAQEQRLRLGEGLVGMVAERREGMIVNDYRHWPFARPLILERTKITAAIAEPLVYRDRLVGVINLTNGDTGLPFDEQDRVLLHLFGAQAAIAIENARLFRGERDRRAQLEALRATTAEITRELDLPRLLHLLIARAAELVGASSATLYLWEPAQGVVVPMAWHGLGEWQATIRHKLGEGIAGTVAETRRGVLANEYRTSRYANPVTLGHTQVTASMGEPLLYRDEIIGAITLNHEGGRIFTAQDQGLLRLLADQAAIAIENARLYEAMVRRSTEREALLQASRAIESSLDLEQVLEAIVQQAAAISAAPIVRLFLLDEDAQLLRCRVGVGFPLDAEPELVIPVGKSLSGEVAATGKPLAVTDTRKDSRTHFPEHVAQYGVISYLGLPVKFQTRLFGVLVFNTPAPRHYTADEIAFLAAFAQQAAMAIQNARLFSAAQQAMEDIQRTQAELVRSEKLRALGQMGAGIAHDLNNVLAVILGQVELLKLRVADPEVRERLLALETAAADGADVVRRLQDFSRPRGASPLVPVALARIVTEVLDMTRPRWRDEPQRQGVRIEVRTALADLPPILGHAPEVREALTNLIFNAVDAMPQGGILTLTGTATSEEVGLAIADTGVGMPEEVCVRVFEPFFTTKGLQGTGLGLAVVYGIMERHSGRIAVTSALGQGTTVTLTFQVAREAEAAPEPPGLAPVTPRRVLIIDDDPMVRQTVASLLRAAGHSVVEADGGAAGFAQLAETPVDCVLTDLGMPELTGWDVARAVRVLHPNLPIVLLTGWGEQAAGEADQQGLVDRVLGKPVRLEELLRVIREITERSAV